MISAGRYNLYVKRGEDFSFTFTVEIDGGTLDLTNATIYSQIREQQARDADTIVAFTVKLDGEDTPNAAPTDNEITLSLTDIQTAAVTASKGYYDVLVVDAGGADTYYLEGAVTFLNSVTVKA